jgi:tyrosyl-tRNA synthetase
VLAKEDVLGKKYAELAVFSGLLSSKGEANRLVKNGGGYLNNQKILDTSFELVDDDLIDGIYLLIGAGKKKKILIQIQ